MSDPNLVTTYNLHGHDYMVKMTVAGGFLELLVTDKQTGEEWQCSYDASYIENLTHKTGNYKQFDIFVTMLKSGLLKTSSSITLDLLTYEDLENMRIRRFKSSSASRTMTGTSANNRRYLIITYTVEFDRIHYPLPLEYCGPPDPQVLQATIQKLRHELAETKTKMGSSHSLRKIQELQSKMDEMFAENLELREKLMQSRQTGPGRKGQNNLKTLQSAINSLEKSVASERRSHHQLVEKLRRDNQILLMEMEKMRNTEKSLKTRLYKALEENKSKQSSDSVQTMYRRVTTPVFNAVRKERARSTSPKPKPNTRHNRNRSVRSRSSSIDSARVLDSSDSPSERFDKLRAFSKKTPVSSRPSSAGSNSSARSKKSGSLHMMIRNSEVEFKNLEQRIEGLHSLLKTNFS